ncbi:hypothetical protein R1flu_022895 [Riccia fluitans]|uniref:NADP-dependent oxidoreductase domain-containing protein n=1 Tax=Riccia fluitans TaxID=41844 RepID=A0ABD1XUJ6_9MARC
MNKLKLINIGHGGPTVEIPMLGLGVWQASPKETVEAVSVALKNGYRHIDTACLYENEAAVGKAVRESGIPREEIFVTTKLWNSDHGYQRCLRAFETSLRELGLDYVDLYLVHSPMAVNQRLDTWRAMEQILKSGKAKSIGVSNYGIQHLQELFSNCKVRPSCNQVELHPFNTRTELVSFCEKEGIVLQAYSPLTQGRKLRHRGLVEIAKQYNKSPAQIMIKWCLQKNFVVLPKSTTPSRIIENISVFDFEISREDMAKLDSFDEGFVTGWDPTGYP